MEDKLDLIFKKQEALQEFLGNAKKIADKDQDYINGMTLYSIDELMEFVRETPFKDWKKNQNFNLEKAQGELVDVLHFFINLCLVCELDGQKLLDLYCKKNKINIDRKKNNY